MISDWVSIFGLSSDPEWSRKYACNTNGITWWDTADYLRERVLNDGTTELKVPAVVKPQTDTTAATPSPTTFGELMQVLDIVPGQSQMPQVTSLQGSSQMRLGSEIPQADNHIVALMPDTVPDSSQMEIATPVPPVSFQPSIEHR